MILTDIGPLGYLKGNAVATLSYQPLLDRAAIVKRISVQNASADDNWIVSTQGQELARFPVNATGFQQMLQPTRSVDQRVMDLFDYCNVQLGRILSYPVPQGQTLTVASAAGATANVTIEFEEHTPGDITQDMYNHPRLARALVPIFLVPSATGTPATGTEADFTSQIGPSWIPTFYGQTNLPAGYSVKVLALFLQGAGRNTYSGSADHLSVTDHLALDYNGQRMLTRTATSGPPVVGQAAAAGSANTVYGTEQTQYPPFLFSWQRGANLISPPFNMAPGSQFRWRLGFTGDTTGGADYSKAIQGMLLDVQLLGQVL